MAAQPEPPAADVDDPAPRPDARQREQLRVAALARAPRRDGRRARPQARLRGAVDVLGGPARHAATLRRGEQHAHGATVATAARDGASSLGAAPMSEAYTPDNLLDRLSDPATLAEQYERGKRRERELLDRHLGLAGGDAISIGCGWHPGRHLLPAPQWRLVAVRHRRRPHAHRRRAGRRGRGRRRRGRRARRARRTVLRRRACTGSSCTTSPTTARSSRACARRTGCCAPAARSSRSSRTSTTRSAPRSRSPTAPGSASRSTARPTTSRCRRGASPRAARAAGLQPQLHAVSYSWRRLPRSLQRAVGALDRFGSAPGLRWAGHTFMLIARQVARQRV